MTKIFHSIQFQEQALSKVRERGPRSVQDIAMLETNAMAPVQLSAWCREKGLFEHQLQSWRDAFCTAGESRQAKAALRELQLKHEGLQRELRRKEKALAEAAALLVLQKKFHALWEGEEK